MLSAAPMNAARAGMMWRVSEGSKAGAARRGRHGTKGQCRAAAPGAAGHAAGSGWESSGRVRPAGPTASHALQAWAAGLTAMAIRMQVEGQRVDGHLEVKPSSHLLSAHSRLLALTGWTQPRPRSSRLCRPARQQAQQGRLGPLQGGSHCRCHAGSRGRLEQHAVAEPQHGGLLGMAAVIGCCYSAGHGEHYVARSRCCIGPRCLWHICQLGACCCWRSRLTLWQVSRQLQRRQLLRRPICCCLLLVLCGPRRQLHRSLLQARPGGRVRHRGSAARRPACRGAISGQRRLFVCLCRLLYRLFHCLGQPGRLALLKLQLQMCPPPGCTLPLLPCWRCCPRRPLWPGPQRQPAHGIHSAGAGALRHAAVRHLQWGSAAARWQWREAIRWLSCRGCPAAGSAHALKPGAPCQQVSLLPWSR